MSADCIGTGCAKESLLARVRELDLQMRGLMLDRQVERGLRERAEAERDDYVRYASKFAEERDALQDELRGCMENFDDACTTLAKLEAERDALRALLRENRDFPNAGDAEAFRQWHKDWCARRDAALGEKP